MVELSGVPLDRELFKVVSGCVCVCVCFSAVLVLQVLELLKLNVAPTNILSVLKTLRYVYSMLRNSIIPCFHVPDPKIPRLQLTIF